MDNLPDWAVSVIAVVVGLSPVIVILSARSIARLLYRALWPRPKRAPRIGREPAHQKPVGQGEGWTGY
jgi:hypothetical protein